MFENLANEQKKRTKKINQTKVIFFLFQNPSRQSNSKRSTLRVNTIPCSALSTYTEAPLIQSFVALHEQRSVFLQTGAELS